MTGETAVMSDRGACRMAFRPGELVAHPIHGLCRIAAIERAQVRDGLEDCYVFRMGTARDPIRVLMPVLQAEAAGLRHPISHRQAETVLHVFQQPATPLEPHLKEELDDVAARLADRDLHVVAATIRDLVAAGVRGWLGQPEGRWVRARGGDQVPLTQTLSRLIEELAYVQHTSRTTIEGRIQTCLGRTRRKRAPQVVRK